MTQEEEYKGKNQRLGYLIQLITFFITLDKTGADLGNKISQEKVIKKIKQLVDDECKEEVKLGVV